MAQGQGFFDPQQVSYSPMLEPAGFDMLRAFLMSQVFQRGANPFGLSPEGMSNMGDRPIVSNQPNMSRLSGFGYSPQGGGSPGSGPSPGQGQPSRRPRSITRYDGRRSEGTRGRQHRPQQGQRQPFANAGSGAFFGGPRPPQLPMPGAAGPRMPAPIRTQPRMPDNPLTPRPIEPPGFGGGMTTQPGRPAGPGLGQPPPITDRAQNPLANHLSGLTRQPSFQGRGF